MMYSQTDRTRMALKDINDLSLQEITHNYLCWKAQRKVSECMKCQEKCAYGKKAIDLTLGPKITGSSVPYEGSMLQKARAEAQLRRELQDRIDSVNEQIEEAKQAEEAVKQAEEAKTQKKRRKNMDPEGWYEEAMKASDPTAWVMEKFGKTRTQAKKKIYMYRYLHPECKVAAIETPKEPVDNKDVEEKKPDEKVEEKKSEISAEMSEDLYLRKIMERKLESLMNKQETFEAEMKKSKDAYEAEVQKLKEKYEANVNNLQSELTRVKEQVDALCKTMDILKE